MSYSFELAPSPYFPSDQSTDTGILSPDALIFIGIVVFLFFVFCLVTLCSMKGLKRKELKREEPKSKKELGGDSRILTLSMDNFLTDTGEEKPISGGDSRFLTLSMDNFLTDTGEEKPISGGDSRFLTLTMDNFLTDTGEEKPISGGNSTFLTLTMDKFLTDIDRMKPIRFTSKQLKMATDNFSFLLGSGGFGKVYKGIFTNGTLVAVKVLFGDSSKKVEQQFMAEVSTMGTIHHFHLVRLYGFCFEQDLTALVYEYMGNGSLDRYLFRDGEKILEFEKLHEIAVGTAKGIAYLHEECHQRIVHYDIKPGNILLDSKFHPKVADFGLAKLCNRENSHVTMTGGRGTPGYAAPELWMPYPITHKCDVYSFGMLLFEIVGRRKNMDSSLPDSQEWYPRWVWMKYENQNLEEIFVGQDIEGKDIEIAERMVKVALWCVQYSAQSRPSMSYVVKMLEGGVDIPMPILNPFQYLEAVNHPGPASSSWAESSEFDSSGATQSLEIETPIMKAHEIELAST